MPLQAASPPTATAAQRRVLRMYLDGAPIAAIAADQGVTTKAIEWRVARLRERLGEAAVPRRPRGAPPGPRGPRRRSLSDEERRLVELWRAGATAPRIAGEFGISTSGVRERIAGLRRLLGPERVPLRQRPAFAARIHELWEQGRTSPEIARELGCPRNTVTSRISELRRRTAAGVRSPGTGHSNSGSRRRSPRSVKLDEEILALRRRGLTVAAIGAETGLSQTAVSARLARLRRALGPDAVPRRQRRGRSWTPQRPGPGAPPWAAEAYRRLRAGESVRRVASLQGIAETTVRYHLDPEYRRRQLARGSARRQTPEGR